MTITRERVYLLGQLLLIAFVGLIATTITVVGFGVALASSDDISIWIFPLGSLLATILCLFGAIALVQRIRYRLRVVRLLRADEPLRGRVVPCVVSGHSGSLFGAIIGYFLVAVCVISVVIFVLDGQLGGGVFMLTGLLIAGLSARLFMRSWRETSGWTNQFGALELVMDPFPGAIGGEFAAGIDIPIPSNKAGGAVARLSCVSVSRESEGPTTETVNWQSELPLIAGAVHGAVRLVARFDVPAGLPPSEYGNPSCEWHLEIRGLDPDAVPFTPTFRVEMQPASWRSKMFRPADK